MTPEPWKERSTVTSRPERCLPGSSDKSLRQRRPRSQRAYRPWVYLFVMAQGIISCCNPRSRLLPYAHASLTCPRTAMLIQPYHCAARARGRPLMSSNQFIDLHLSLGVFQANKFQDCSRERRTKTAFPVRSVLAERIETHLYIHVSICNFQVSS